MKNCIRISIAGALLLLPLRALLPDYVLFLFLAYLFLLLFCKKDENLFIKWLIFYFPFFVIHSLPTIVHLYFDNSIFTNSFALNSFMTIVNVLMPASIFAVIYIQRYKQWGVFIVLATIISILPGFFSKSLQIFLAGSSFSFLTFFYPFNEKLSQFQKFVQIYLLFFVVFSISWLYELLFVGRSISSRGQIIPIDLVVPIAIYMGLILRKVKRKYVYLTLLPVIFALIGYIGYPNYYTLLYKNNSYKTLPDIKLTTYKGKKIILDDEFKNHISVFNIWSAHCGVCIKEMPYYEKLTRKYANNDKVTFYSVYLADRNDNYKLVDKIKKQYNIDIYIGDSTFKNTLHIDYVPKMLIAVDRKIVYYGTPEYDAVNYYNAYKIINDYPTD